jgi:hypothetical protein
MVSISFIQYEIRRISVHSLSPPIPRRRNRTHPHFIRRKASPRPKPRPQPEMEQEQRSQPEWVENILKLNAESQKTMAAALQQFSSALEKLNPPCPLRHDEVYDFKPSDSPEDIEYFLFKERISDLVGQYGDDRVWPALLACLQNARARQWYASLSNIEKSALTHNCDRWKELLIRDFGIRPGKAYLLAQGEKFAFSQERPVLTYYNTKLAWLKIAGIEDEDRLCMDIREGLMDPEYR